MSSDKKSTGPAALPFANLPSVTPADTSLSAAFRHVLGKKGAESPFAPSGNNKGAEIAKWAKPDKPGASAKGSPHNARKGPRTGHK
jgi:hypothetical protein